MDNELGRSGPHIDPTFLFKFVHFKWLQASREVKVSKYAHLIPIATTLLLGYRLSFAPSNFLIFINFAVYISELMCALLNLEKVKKEFGIKEIQISHDFMNVNYDSTNFKFIKAYLDKLNLDYSNLQISDKFIDLKRDKAIYDEILKAKSKKVVD
ncbi:hypothetical protein RF11_01654 [Thelohanellus kitauei]|uniref:Uncharacterized protein n=1 Tax=Thelohanellus kitauei TaxID=669202 RepID=A0A0C2IXU6_THEKT|nr:hypothetical protein RF11_01654 [Thelohanellus kitauei]